MRESKVDKLIETDLQNLPDVWYKKIHANVYQQTGVPDFLGSFQGRFFAIEAKAGNGHTLGVMQLFNGYKIAQSGGIFVVAYPDYTSLMDLEFQEFDFELHGEQPNKLSREEYALLEKVYRQINADKKTVAFG